MKVYEGTIISCDRAGRVHRYLAEHKGRIAYAGEALPAEYAGAPREKLGVRALVPAFGDTHAHLLSHAFFSAGLDVRGARTLDELAGAVRDFARDRDDGVIVGFGASPHSVAERRMITRAELDGACPDRAVLLVKYDGHAAVANSRLLGMLPGRVRGLRGFDPETGALGLEAFYAATDFAAKKVPLPRALAGLLRAVDGMAARGIGLVHSAAGVGFPLDLDVSMETLLFRGLDSGFQGRVYFQTMDIGKVRRRGLPRVGGCFAAALDGCFGSADAALLEPYSDDARSKGTLFFSDRQAADFVKRANRAGLQAAMHAIGDAAFEQAVRAIEAALADFPRGDHRHTIIHACLPTDEGLEKCARLGIHLAVQPAFLGWEQEPWEYLERILGGRAAGFCPLRRVADMGITMSGGSDAPCTPPDPMLGVHAACNHPVPGQSLTAAEALRLFTYNAAWASFDEGERGSLETGKIADMAVLSGDPLTVEPAALAGLKVEKLLLKGEPYRGGQGVLGALARGLLGGGRA
jgi:predicted amidohydrolase YtcJ